MNPDKEIKPSEYFKHLLVYKDGRFARHRRWRYFALNSLMRRRASSEEINDDPDDLIGPAVDDIQEVDGNDSDEEDDDTPQEAYELRTDWMLLAEMMPNRQTRSLDDFSARDIDRITTGLTKVCYDIMKLKRQKASSSRQLVTTK
ncbi:hypothetical protein RhiirB3_472641 [Rhizophagus irregularis]|nr:hypothetical protein RhiirB3_472641 [Rhizophagus irregularis]